MRQEGNCVYYGILKSRFDAMKLDILCRWIFSWDRERNTRRFIIRIWYCEQCFPSIPCGRYTLLLQNPIAERETTHPIRWINSLKNPNELEKSSTNENLWISFYSGNKRSANMKRSCRSRFSPRKASRLPRTIFAIVIFTGSWVSGREKRILAKRLTAKDFRK